MEPEKQPGRVFCSTLLFQILTCYPPFTRSLTLRSLMRSLERSPKLFSKSIIRLAATFNRQKSESLSERLKYSSQIDSRRMKN